MKDDAASDLGPNTVPLLVRRAGNFDVQHALDALRDVRWLGRLVDGPPASRRLRRVATNLELPIADGSATGPIRKAALIDVGQPRLTDGSVIVDISWRSASFAPLFPVFAGRVEIARDGIVLDGRYAPPVGQVGLLLDQALLHLVARRTASALMARLARQFAG